MYVRPRPTVKYSGPTGVTGPDGWTGELTRPILHMGNFRLPSERGDFGSGAVDIMGPHNLFIAVLEYGPESVGTELFAPQGIARVGPTDFNPNCLQRRLPGQAGYQRFCTVSERAFCVYIVLGSGSNAKKLSTAASAVLATVEVQR